MVYEKEKVKIFNAVNVLMLAIKQGSMKLCVSFIFLISLIGKTWCSRCISGTVVINNLGFLTWTSHEKTQGLQIQTQWNKFISKFRCFKHLYGLRHKYYQLPVLMSLIKKMNLLCCKTVVIKYFYQWKNIIKTLMVLYFKLSWLLSLTDISNRYGFLTLSWSFAQGIPTQKAKSCNFVFIITHV